MERQVGGVGPETIHILPAANCFPSSVPARSELGGAGGPAGGNLGRPGTAFADPGAVTPAWGLGPGAGQAVGTRV